MSTRHKLFLSPKTGTFCWLRVVPPRTRAQLPPCQPGKIPKHVASNSKNASKPVLVIEMWKKNLNERKINIFRPHLKCLRVPSGLVDDTMPAKYAINFHGTNRGGIGFSAGTRTMIVQARKRCHSPLHHRHQPL